MAGNGDLCQSWTLWQNPTARDQVLPVRISYLNPETCRIEQIAINLASIASSWLKRQSLPALNLPERMVSAIRYTNQSRKVCLIPISSICCIAIVIATRRSAFRLSTSFGRWFYGTQMDTPVRLKKVFDNVMEFLIDEEVVDQFPYLPHDGLEAMRGCLCSKAHVFSGFSSRLKGQSESRSPGSAQGLPRLFPALYDATIAGPVSLQKQS